MEEMIQVFRMEEIPKEKRAKIIIQLGRAINNQHGMSITEGIVYELVSVLYPAHPILKDERFLKQASKF